MTPPTSQDGPESTCRATGQEGRAEVLGTAWRGECYPGCPCCEDEDGPGEPLRPMAQAPKDRTHITVRTEDDEFGAWFDPIAQCWRDEENRPIGRTTLWGWRP